MSYLEDMFANENPTGGRAGELAYAWVITYDQFAEEDGGTTKGDVGTAGPRGATPEQVALAAAAGALFRMKDDDGEIYYAGRIWVDGMSADPGSLGDEHFGPLDDFGTPNAGCTSIEYKMSDGRWEVL